MFMMQPVPAFIGAAIGAVLVVGAAVNWRLDWSKGSLVPVADHCRSRASQYIPIAREKTLEMIRITNRQLDGGGTAYDPSDLQVGLETILSALNTMDEGCGGHDQ
jgi:hypothetical protein